MTKTKDDDGVSAQKAQDAVAEAILRGDLAAAKKIGRSFYELRAAKERLTERRKELNAELGAKEATLSGSIEEPIDSKDPVAARAKLEAIVDAYQEVEEAKSKKKDEVSLLRGKVTELSGVLEQQVEGAKQLGLFDDD